MPGSFNSSMSCVYVSKQVACTKRATASQSFNSVTIAWPVYLPSGKSAPTVTGSHAVNLFLPVADLLRNRCSALTPSSSRNGGSGDSTTCIIACTAFSGSPLCLPSFSAKYCACCRQSRRNPQCVVSASTPERPRKSVRNGPGSMIVTRIPSGASSAASDSDNPSTANFVRVIEAQSRAGNHAANRREIENVTAALLAKLRQKCARHPQQPKDIGLEHRHKFRLGDLFDRARNAIARIVHQHIHTPELRQRLRYRRIHLSGRWSHPAQAPSPSADTSLQDPPSCPPCAPWRQPCRPPSKPLRPAAGQSRSMPP